VRELVGLELDQGILQDAIVMRLCGNESKRYESSRSAGIISLALLRSDLGLWNASQEIRPLAALLPANMLTFCDGRCSFTYGSVGSGNEVL
jgi:hypothetical protein